jgi:hypothetical protein
MLRQTFYDQIPYFIDRNDTTIGFPRKSIVSDYISEYDTKMSLKKENTIREINKRILQYTYKI